jgi:hypothetical protein
MYDDYLDDTDTQGDATIQDVVRIARQNPERFLNLVDMYCSPETKELARRSMKAWGIEVKRKRYEEGPGNRSARGRKDHRNR